MGPVTSEQIQGQQADSRSDLFAFGATLYEMLSGKKAFEGKSQISVVSAILEKDPEPLGKLQPVTPPPLERIVSKCLAKDPEERWQSARDLASELRWIAEGEEARAAAGGPAAKGRLRGLLYAAVAGALLSAVTFTLISYWRAARLAARASISEIAPPDNARFIFVGANSGAPALAPDGHAVAFCAMDEGGTEKLWVRSLDSLAAHPLAGTEGASDPFWSPDSRALGFFADGMLKTIDASAGAVIVVAPAPNDGGGSWSRDATILFVSDFTKGIYRVPATGGNPALVVSLETTKFTFCSNPKFLPDGRRFVYWAGSGDPALAGSYIASLDGKERRLLVRNDAGGAFVSGFFLDVRAGALIAQRFDADRAQLKGDPLPVAPLVGSANGIGLFDVSQNGLLIYAPGGASKQLTWLDRKGKNLGPVGVAGDYYDLRLSPDGRRLAFNAGYPSGSPNSEIWVDELARSVDMRLTIDPATDHGVPVWSPDGKRIAYSALQGKASSGIYQKPANGAGAEELILQAENSSTQAWPTSWSYDGKFLLYTQGNITLTPADIWILPLGNKPHLFMKAPASAYDGQFSPNGRWVSYTSRESGRAEVYLVPFDAANNASGSGKWLISPNGGSCPRWRRDGKEIFYLSPTSQMMAAEVMEKGNGIEVSTAQPLFREPIMNSFSPYDVTADGQKFVVNSFQSGQNKPLTLVMNWTAILTKQ